MKSKPYQIIENGKTIDTIDPKEFLISSDISNVYCFPFDQKDISPTAQRYSGNSLGTIEWLFEPREFKWNKSAKIYYITKLLLWTRQTRDKRYYGKIFSIDCYTESIGGIAHKFREFEEGVVNQTWLLMFAHHTKTPVFATYPHSNFDVLLVKATSSISLDINFIRSNTMTPDYPYYEQIKKVLSNQKKEYIE